MALFDIDDLINDLNTIIAGLDLPNEDEQRLAVLIKAAKNVGETPTDIINELQTRIEAIDNTVLLEKFAVFVGALNISTEDRIVAVATINDLPDLFQTNFPNGSIFFVNEINVLVISAGNKWIGLDGRLLRNDNPIIEALSWGSGIDGRLGDNTTTAKSSPVTVAGGITNWKQVSAGNAHSLGVTDDGIAYAWGLNTSGRLGDGTTLGKQSPVTVVGAITNWKQVSAGNVHSLGVTNDGIAYAWGSGTNGRLGDDTTAAKSSPITVVGNITNWKQVSAGNAHSLGVTDDGIAYAWGSGTNGRLGDDTTAARSSPVTVAGGITNWSQVSAGSAHSLGVTDDGVAYAWGIGSYGILGDNTAITKSSPVTVAGGITNWSQVSAGNYHSFGLTDDGIAYAWGSNISAALGDGTTINKSSPVTVVGGNTNWSQVSAGGFHSLGITDDGIAYAWGSNFSGQLGDDTTTNKSSPVTVVGGITNWSQVSAGGFNHSLGIKISE